VLVLYFDFTTDFHSDVIAILIFIFTSELMGKFTSVSQPLGGIYLIFTCVTTPTSHFILMILSFAVVFRLSKKLRGETGFSSIRSGLSCMYSGFSSRDFCHLLPIPRFRDINS